MKWECWTIICWTRPFRFYTCQASIDVSKLIITSWKRGLSRSLAAPSGLVLPSADLECRLRELQTHAMLTSGTGVKNKATALCFSRDLLCFRAFLACLVSSLLLTIQRKLGLTQWLQAERCAWLKPNKHTNKQEPDASFCCSNSVEHIRYIHLSTFTHFQRARAARLS